MESLLRLQFIEINPASKETRFIEQKRAISNVDQDFNFQSICAKTTVSRPSVAASLPCVYRLSIPRSQQRSNLHHSNRQQTCCRSDLEFPSCRLSPLVRLIAPCLL